MEFFRWGNHDWKFDRNVATTGGRAKSRAWTSDGVVCWLVTYMLIHASSVKITYLIITQCPREFRQYLCFRAWSTNPGQPGFARIATAASSDRDIFCEYHELCTLRFSLGHGIRHEIFPGYIIYIYLHHIPRGIFSSNVTIILIYNVGNFKYKTGIWYLVRYSPHASPHITCPFLCPVSIYKVELGLDHCIITHLNGQSA